jgi:uncharacterized membrane protein
MFFATVTVIGLAAIAAVTLIGRREGVFCGPHLVRVKQPTSPIDEAERILARRYVKGEITPEEYDRMMAILGR